MAKKDAIVICCNDAIKAVVIQDQDKALTEMNKLKKNHKSKTSVNSHCEYDDVYFWHFHIVKVL